MEEKNNVFDSNRISQKTGFGDSYVSNKCQHSGSLNN